VPEQADLREQLLEAVDDQTSPDAPWTTTRAVAQAVDVDADQVKGELQRAANADELLGWRGRYVPADVEHLVAVIERERDADTTRTLLVGRANRLVQEVRDDGE